MALDSAEPADPAADSAAKPARGSQRESAREPAALRLDPMTGDEYRRYLDAAISGYAAEKVASGAWAAEGSVERSRTEHDELLPDGLASADQYLYVARFADAEPLAPDTVGILWIALRDSAGRREAYIYDIEVRDGLRGRGLGRALMLAGIGRARELGAETVGLHVFGHNSAARSLYESLGFVPTSIVMSLEL